MSKPKRIFVVGHMGAGKALLSEEVATLTIESVSVEDDVNKIIRTIEE